MQPAIFVKSFCRLFVALEKMEDIQKNEDVSDQEYEDDEEEARGGGKRAKYETDEEGNHIICEVCEYRSSSSMFCDLRLRFRIPCKLVLRRGDWEEKRWDPGSGQFISSPLSSCLRCYYGTSHVLVIEV